jgi:hypothetical protein
MMPHIHRIEASIGCGFAHEPQLLPNTSIPVHPTTSKSCSSCYTAVSQDAALERRFQQVMVEPPSVLETVSILRGLREK